MNAQVALEQVDTLLALLVVLVQMLYTWHSESNSQADVAVTFWPWAGLGRLRQSLNFIPQADTQLLSLPCATVSRPQFFTLFHPQMSGETLDLIYLLWPDENPDEDIVEVQVYEHDTVAHLKRMIIKNHANTLGHFDPHDVVLWKCSGLPHDDSLKQALETLQFDGSDVHLVRLTAREQISKHFRGKNLSNEPIHILVKVPLLGECVPY